MVSLWSSSGPTPPKTRAEAPAELKIDGIAKVATRTAKAWRASRGANVANKGKRETRDGKGPAPAQEIPISRSRAVPTPGRWESMIALDSLLKWYQEQKLVKQIYWTARLLDAIKNSIF